MMKRKLLLLAMAFSTKPTYATEEMLSVLWQNMPRTTYEVVEEDNPETGKKTVYLQTTKWIGSSQVSSDQSEVINGQDYQLSPDYTIENSVVKAQLLKRIPRRNAGDKKEQAVVVVNGITKSINLPRHTYFEKIKSVTLTPVLDKGCFLYCRYQLSPSHAIRFTGIPSQPIRKEFVRYEHQAARQGSSRKGVSYRIENLFIVSKKQKIYLTQNIKDKKRPLFHETFIGPWQTNDQNNRAERKFAFFLRIGIGK